MMKLAMVFAVAVLAACARVNPQVPVLARPADLASLAGEWAGTYETRSVPERSGRISFSLTARQDTATGYVIMTYVPQGIATDARTNAAPFPQSELLEIAFVRATSGRITGELEQYRDPFCGCRVQTVFTGEVVGDQIRGTFVSTHLDGLEVIKGEWRATRFRKLD